MIHLREQYFALQVADANNAVISGNTITWKTENAQARGFIPLPPGTWEVVCTTNAITRDKAYNIIEHDGEGYKDYNKAALNFMSNIPFGDPLTSFASLLTSKGCDLKNNYLILKKQ
jgi:hypothetical protein